MRNFATDFHAKKNKTIVDMNIAELYNIFTSHPTVTTDSRECPEGSIFFALKGASFNGNAFAAKALEQGCAYAVVDEAQYAVQGDSRYILTDNCLDTLQQLTLEFHKCDHQFWKRMEDPAGGSQPEIPEDLLDDASTPPDANAGDPETKSESVGSYSRTLTTGGEAAKSVLDAVSTSKQMLANLCNEYLAHTGLLYRGGDCKCTLPTL